MWKVSGLSRVGGSRISTLFFIRFSKTFHLGLPPSHVSSQLMSLSDNGETEGKIAPKVGSPHEFCGRSAISSSLQSSVRSFSTKMPGEVAVLRFVKLTENAFAPAKGSELAAGYDLKSAYDYIIPACGKELVKTDLQIQLPEGCYGRVAPRSGLAWKHHIDIGAGVIDADYTGNLGIVMFNHGREDFTVKAGDRVAQLICEKICYPELQEVKAVSETTRGAGGFGSTGKN